MECMEFVVPWLVWPVSLTTFVAKGWRSYRQKTLLQTLPLIATQLNSTIIWACLAAEQVGYSNFEINGTRIEHDDFRSLRSFMIT